VENILLIEFLIFIIAILGGTIGSLIGLGGALVITPALVSLMGIPIHQAIGASLVATICTSTATSIVSLNSHGLTKEKLGLFLALATAFGAMFGAKLALSMPAKPLFLTFGLVLVVVLLLNLIKRKKTDKAKLSTIAEALQLNDQYIINNKTYFYNVSNPILGLIAMIGAGFIGGLLGIGAGLFKVLAMDKIMKIPFKVSSSTSNFIMGITGFTAASAYYFSGNIDPNITLPVALGALLGATMGSKIMPNIDTKILRVLFFIVILIATLQMLYKGLV
jgi:uncharacterized membrane protein YfcA